MTERKPMEPVGYGHRTAHGWVVSKTPLAPDSEPLLPVSVVREAVERVRHEHHTAGTMADDALLAELGQEEEP